MTISALPAGEPIKLEIFGIPVVDAHRDTVIAWIDAAIAANRRMRIAFLNAHSANIAWEDGSFRDILRGFTVLADGIGVDIAARRLHGRRFAANLNGTDFVPALLQAIERPLRVAVLGARRESGEKAVERLAALAPQHEFLYLGDGYFTKDSEQTVVARIGTLKPDILLVAMGVPMQEKWMARHLAEAPCTVAIGVGALLDFLSGTATRAPLWMRRARVEWLYRLLREPRRLARRYLVGNPLFLRRVLRESARSRRP